MSKHYTDEDVQAAIRAYWRTDSDSPLTDGFMPAVLNAVAPAIAARALRREAIRIISDGLESGHGLTALLHAVNVRADEIEAGR